MSLAVLKDEIQKAVQRYCLESVHRDTAIKALCRPGYALDSQSSCRAGMLTIEICKAINGEDTEIGMKAATAVELIMEAGFMFDSVADEDPDPTGILTPSEEIALAITLLSWGVAIAHEAAASANGSGASAVIQIQINSIAASAGQFLDAYLQKSTSASPEQSLNMTRLKSGSIGKLAGEFSASVCTSDADIINLFSEFGFNLFTYLQLIDDVRDAMPTDGPSTDFMQSKKTLPLVFFKNVVEQSYSGKDSDIIFDSPTEPELEVRELFEQSGSKSFCAVIAESYLNRAKSNLAELTLKLVTVSNLERLVGSLEISPNEISMAS